MIKQEMDFQKKLHIYNRFTQNYENFIFPKNLKKGKI